MRIKIVLISVCALSLLASYSAASPNHHQHKGARDHHKPFNSNSSNKTSKCNDPNRIVKNKLATDKIIEQLVVAANRETRRALMKQYYDITKCY